jgi:uncharacterized membrane protein
MKSIITNSAIYFVGLMALIQVGVMSMAVITQPTPNLMENVMTGASFAAIVLFFCWFPALVVAILAAVMHYLIKSNVNR